LSLRRTSREPPPVRSRNSRAYSVLRSGSGHYAIRSKAVGQEPLDLVPLAAGDDAFLVHPANAAAVLLAHHQVVQAAVLVHHLAGGRDLEPFGLEGLIDVAIVEALYQSANTGRPVSLALPDKKQWPSRDQVIKRPPVRKPTLVRVKSPSL